MNLNKIIDVSRKISPKISVWPGDKAVKINKECSIQSGDKCNISSLELCVHTSTHIDAPYHFIDNGKTIEAIDLNRFIGFAKVFELNAKECIKASDIENLPIENGDVVFFKTSNSFIDATEEFKKDFIYLDKSAAEYLSGKNIKTVGVDYLSVEAYFSSDYPVHHILLSNNIGIIEGLCLKEVKEGKYFFSSLPLKIEGVDGSPTRTVLIEV